MKKSILIFTVFNLLVSGGWVFAQEQSQPLNFFAYNEEGSEFYPVYFNGQPAEDGWIIQVVCAGADGIINPPIMTGPETGMPSGDDFLADPVYNNVQYFYFNSAENSTPLGTFTMLSSVNCRAVGYHPGENIIRVGDAIYLRAFNSDQWSTATLYAEFTTPFVVTLQSAGKPFDVYEAECLSAGAGAGAGLVITEYKLYQNHPNPFKPTTSIQYDVLESGKVYLVIYNVSGQEVAKLVDGVYRQGGMRYAVNWNAERLSSGIYFYQIMVNDFKAVKKMLLLR
jgi:hypothetical protein